MVLVAYPECFESVMAAKGTLCAESFFTFGAGVFQACSAILAFQIWWSMPQSSGYSLVLQDAPQSRPGDATEAPQDARGQTLWPQLSAMDARNP